MKRCNKCGYPNPEGRTECFKCSARLDESVTVPKKPEPPDSVQGQPVEETEGLTESDTSENTQENVGANTPVKQVNGQSIFSAVMTLLIIGGILYWIFGSGAGYNTKVPPTIEVTGIGASMVSFTDWKRDGGELTAKVTFTQGGLSYDMKCSAYDSSGVKLSENPVFFPSLQAGETGIAKTFINSTDSPAKLVIEVNY